MKEFEYDDHAAAFVEELTALSKKYGIVIEGCGCCESPYLEYTANVGDGRYAFNENAHKYNGSALKWWVGE